ncbi:MAG: CHAT domain-containing protein, partial [Acidobacteriota bacterium]
IWTLTASGSEWTEVEVERSQLDRWVEDVADLKRPLAETKAVRSELYRCLVEPIGGRLEGADVVILAPDRPLHRLAFPFLRGPEEAAPFLIDEHALVVTPSVTATLAETLAASVTQTHRAPLSEGEVLVVGEPQLSEVRVEKLGGLPMAGVEAKALKDRYPDARVLLGANADRERLLAHLPNARIFHFAGHALAHPDPNSTRLVLAGDLADRPQGLFASEIRRLELEGLELVVLSACDTARTRDADVSGTLSLAAPFLVAGARHVVATLGPVDDRLAAKVSVGLHQQISQGSSPAQALRAVQNELARGSSRGEWASFRVLGHRH